MNWSFLSSVRFWKLFLIGIVSGLNVPYPDNVWLQALSVTIGVWFGGSVLVRTIDKISEPVVLPAEEAPLPPVDITTAEIETLNGLLTKLKS